MTQTALLAEQIRRAFEGGAWHGDSLAELLSGVSAAKAAARPIKDVHSIWELVLHIAAWDGAVCRRLAGSAVTLSDEENFPSVTGNSESAWQKTVENLNHVHRDLVRAVAAFPDSRLGEQVPGKTEKHHDFYYMISGIVQHELYHAGQIAILKKA
jgi:uncharacterized damage-inducible protein DinB